MVNYWRTYLIGKTFDVVIDHQCLTWLQGLKEPKGRLVRRILSLQEYQFHIKHRPGKQNGNADTLSRYPVNTTPLDSPVTDDDQLVVGVGVTEISAQWSFSELQHAQRSVRGIGRVICQLATEKAQPEAHEDWGADGELRRYRQLWPQLEMWNGVLYRRVEKGDRDERLVLIVRGR